jgi:isoleucyl-tRNA synthetase
VAAAVKPDMTYVRVKQGDKSFYMGKGNFEAARKQPIENAEKLKAPSLMSIQALFKNNGAFEVVEELPGKALVGRKYHGPFDQLAGAAEAVPVHAVIAWDAVTETEGTGIVHIAPGCGAEDYALGKELGLPQIAPLLEDGKFRVEFGFLADKRFDQVADEVVADLKQRGLLFAKEQYWHRYPHCWRCKDELVYRLVDEWFINMKWRDEIMESARQSQWIPAWGLERELDWLRNMGDWMISKKRYWGLALPIWECHKCGHFDVIGGREELKARAAGGWEEFEGNSPHRPWVDSVKISCSQCGDEDMTRIKDVGNPWLDASIVPFSTMGYFSDRKYWKEWFPAEFVVEALPGQFRNWFYALLTVSTMMEDCSPFKVLKGHGLVLDDEGKPMHKSAGNAIEFNQAADSIGVDVMRWLYASTSPERNVLFGPHHCDEVRRDVILPLWNVYSFFCNLARVDDFQPAVHTVKPDERSKLDRWILSDLHRFIDTSYEGYRTFDVARVCTEAHRFIDVLSTWYVRRSRRRFYGEGWPADKRAAYSTLYEVLTTFTRALAPIIPFLSEAMYQNLVANQGGGDHPESVHHVPFPVSHEAWKDETLSSTVAASIRIVSLARSARKDANLKIRQPLARLIVVPGNDEERKAVELFENDITEELNIKVVEIRNERDGLYTLSIAPNMKTLGPKFGRSIGEAKKAIAGMNPQELEASLNRGDSLEAKVEGADALIGREDVIVTKTYKADWAGNSDGATIVLLDKRITPELKNEGLARDIIRNVQNLRKDAGLDIADRIHLGLITDSQELRDTIRHTRDYIAGETLATEILPDAPKGASAKSEVGIEGQRLVIELAKA